VVLEKICGRPPTTWAAWIHQIHAAGGASSSTTMVMVLVCCLCFLCLLIWSSSLIVCRQVRERCDKYERITFFNPKEGLKTLLFAPHWLAPHQVRLMLMIRTSLHAILTKNVVTICMKSQSYFGMNLFQTIAFLWKQSWKNSKQDGVDHVITFSCALVILLRYVFSCSQAFTSHQYT